jgi:hypothetical protein
MKDVFRLLVCLVLLTLTLAIAVKLGENCSASLLQEGFEVPSVPVTAQIAYEDSEKDGTGPILTGSYDQATNNVLRDSPRTGQIMDRELINPQLET